MSFDGSVATHIDLPSLPAGWIWKNLSELVDPNRGICYGIVQPGKHDPIGVPMVNTGDVFDGNVARDIAFKVSTDLHSKFRRSTLRGGELLVTLVGANFGRVAIAPERFKGFNCSRAVGVVPLIEDAKYVMFALRSPLTRHLMDTWANTTAQPTFNLKDLGNLPIPLPPKFEREVIAEAIGAFDDRINLLRETNTTLEAIAQALFKFWFVDFDPVHAKMQGLAPEGIDEATAALFPDSFEDSELGPVPKGWRIETLGDVCSYLNRGISPKYLEEGGVLVINQKCIRDFSVDYSKARRHDSAQRKIDGRQVEVGDILVNSTGVGTLGRVAQVLTLDEVTIVDSHVTVVRAGEKLSWPYLGQWMIRQQPNIEAMGEGSTGQTELARSKLAVLPILVPSADALMAFDALVKSLKERVAVNEAGASGLAKLRDTLLPRLISGQLRISEAQNEMENV
jgi:type I restriction enzyme S subunit